MSKILNDIAEFIISDICFKSEMEATMTTQALVRIMKFSEKDTMGIEMFEAMTDIGEVDELKSMFMIDAVMRLNTMVDHGKRMLYLQLHREVYDAVRYFLSIAPRHSLMSENTGVNPVYPYGFICNKFNDHMALDLEKGYNVYAPYACEIVDIYNHAIVIDVSNDIYIAITGANFNTDILKKGTRVPAGFELGSTMGTISKITLRYKHIPLNPILLLN